MMCLAIDNPASFEIGAVIRFLHSKNMSAAEIHRELCAVCGQKCNERRNSKTMVDGRINIHDEERSGRPYIVSDDLVESADQKICERRRFTIIELSCEFPEISPTVLDEIITIGPGCHKFRARWVPKMSMGKRKRREWLRP
jgi:hypothetical protein